MTIEKARDADSKEILLVINRTNRQAYRDVIPREQFRDPFLTLAQLREAMTRMSFYLYRREGKVIGVAALDVEGERVGRIRRLYVLPGYQRRGIGRALIAHLEREAIKIGIQGLRLSVAESASWAVRFYEKLGYTVTDRIERPPGPVLVMEKQIDDKGADLMTKTYRLGAIGFAHMHVNSLLDRFAELPNVEWVACADTVPAVPSLTAKPSSRRANLKRAQQVTGIPRAYDDYREMLEVEQFDIVIFCPENARHGEVAEAIARAGAHMVTEKPMAASLSGALRMVRAAQANGVSLMVNWPTTWFPAVRKMKALIDEGAVGDVWEVKWRNGASMGPLSYSKGEDAYIDVEKGAEWWHQSAPGGGALLDYCCYGACLSRWFLGQPAVAATAMKANLTSHYGDADDNAVIVVRFPRALAILEGTWTTWNVGVPTGPIAYGTQGTLVANRRPDPKGGRPRSVVEVYTARDHGLVEPDQVVEGEPLPKGRATLAQEFVHHLESGEPLHPTLDIMQNLQVMAILDAGIRSASSGQVELVNDATWCIG